jgi:hypothetical protein
LINEGSQLDPDVKMMILDHFQRLDEWKRLMSILILGGGVGGKNVNRDLNIDEVAEILQISPGSTRGMWQRILYSPTKKITKIDSA